MTSFLDLSSVPDVFAGWGCGCLDSPGKLTQVFGWPVTDSREGQILGGYVAQHFKGQKVAVAFAPDLTGKAEMTGFKAAAHGVAIVARTAVASGANAAAAVSAARSAHAQVLVAFTSPGATTTALSAAITAAHLQIPLVAAGSGLGLGLPDGAITDGFLPSQAAPANSPAGSWVTLFGKIQARYLHGTPLSPSLVEGMASAYEMAAAMFRAGPALTRQSLLTALDGMQPGPAAGPLAYTMTDHGGAAAAYIGIVQHGGISPAAGILAATGPVGTGTPYTSRPQAAPTNGIPPH